MPFRPNTSGGEKRSGYIFPHWEAIKGRASYGSRSGLKPRAKSRRSLARAVVITFLLTWEGAEKCALRHLRRDEDTDALNFIAAARTLETAQEAAAIAPKCAHN